MAWALAETLRTGGTPTQPECDALIALLDLHVVKEETGLYPELLDARGVSAQQVEELEQEHRDIRNKLVSGSWGRRDYFELAAHTETEETELFPMTVFGFDADDWDEMGRHHREAERDSPRAVDAHRT